MKKLFLTSFVFTTQKTFRQCADKVALLHGFSDWPSLPLKDVFCKEVFEMGSKQSSKEHIEQRLVVSQDYDTAMFASNAWFKENFPESQLIRCQTYDAIDAMIPTANLGDSTKIEYENKAISITSFQLENLLHDFFNYRSDVCHLEASQQEAMENEWKTFIYKDY